MHAEWLFSQERHRPRSRRIRVSMGSSNFSAIEVDKFVSDFQYPELEDSSGIDDDFDWCRPAPDEQLEGDYNNIFDDDPGFAK
ncbi:MAG: hypothetical protein CM1200mP16_05530 [Nitrospina sp.]|nr:MAG: hypothetical protein CM1200mP16_05530 [Nitrospina sp.]